MKQEIRRLQKQMRNCKDIFEVFDIYDTLEPHLANNNKYTKELNRVSSYTSNSKKTNLLIKKFNRRFMEGK